MSSPPVVPHPDLVPAAARANLVLVAQGLEAVQRLGTVHYATPVAGCFNSSAGGHFRHAIEHYQALLHAVETGELDYENRARDLRIEGEPDHAIVAWHQIGEGIKRLAGGTVTDRMLRLAAETTDGGVLVTSLTRELEFLINHTVHHFALIAVIAHAHGVVLPTDFGMAPSTLKYRRTLAPACAR